MNERFFWDKIICSRKLDFFEKSETPAAPAKKAESSANAGRTQMTMDTIKERKYYFVTTDMAQLKAAWAEAELGE